jgi:hypothetical protein
MNKQNIKSILTNARLRLAAVTCLILAGLGLPTAELVRGGGSPPQPINVTVFIPASVCGFPVQATATGRLGGLVCQAVAFSLPPQLPPPFSRTSPIPRKV